MQQQLNSQFIKMKNLKIIKSLWAVSGVEHAKFILSRVICDHHIILDEWNPYTHE